MKKLSVLFTIMAAALLFFGCNKDVPQDEPDNEVVQKEKPTEPKYTTLQKQGYSITYLEGLESSIKIDEENKTITLSPAEEKTEYTFTGNYSGQIINKTKNTVIILKGFNITNTEGKAAVYGEKKTEIKAEKDTENTIIVTGSGDGKAALYIDGKNLEIGGSGKLTISSEKAHAVKADEIELKGSGTFIFDGGNKSSGINCNDFVVEAEKTFNATIKDSKNGIKADNSITIGSGTFIFEDISETALKTTETKGETKQYTITLNGGSFTFTNCNVIYATDTFTKSDSVTWTVE